MELNPTRRVQSRKRKPLSDFTNTFDSHSSSSLPIKPNPLFSSPFNKTSAKRISSTNPSNPTSPILSTPSLKSSSLHGTSDVEASGPISITYNRKRNLNQRRDNGKTVANSISSNSNQIKDKGKALAFSISSAPNLKISNTWEKSGRFDGANVPKTKALTVPLRKKHRSVSSEQDVLKDPVLQDFIKKQRAYFKAIDEFELSVEEVESGDELD
ncbi:hypothetical protein Lal_00025117 [Lupinus albus]|uniref:Sororin C-terminal region domain-containing protein n=1 Tax=Lupinus albus TaxID=3870 RepID=A0A6A5NXX7_LUPAL|nr:hypothetical protein Lalb_Chr10g0105401 [Lupinus albus]KAF1889788.1 hypothetical protein Lal_00025117 [Lupinus albus]